MAITDYEVVVKVYALKPIALGFYRKRLHETLTGKISGDNLKKLEDTLKVKE
jgi:hypothetical protein